MKIFRGNSANDAWYKAASFFRKDINLIETASRIGFTKEILHAGFEIFNPLNRWIVSRIPPINPAFAIAEVIWIINGLNDAKFLNYWNRNLPKFAGEQDKYHGAYGHRLRKHFNFDQLNLAYETLKHNPTSRQVLLQIWDPSSDLPKDKGLPLNPDIPCNVISLLKIRNNKLEWMQIIRSNDLVLGVPYNLVQFTYLQEIIAGWLNVEVGSYNQISDSLHLYQDSENFIHNAVKAKVKTNTDRIGIEKQRSEALFGELKDKVYLLIGESLSLEEHTNLSDWNTAPKAFQNLLSLLSAEAARRRGWTEPSQNIMKNCSNPILNQVWLNWLNRMHVKQLAS